MHIVTSQTDGVLRLNNLPHIEAYADSSMRPQMASQLVRLNIGGTVFTTRNATLKRFPGSILGSLSHDVAEYDAASDTYFFDRNSVVFHYVLEWYRTGELHLPTSLCAGVVRRELRFWGLNLETNICTCCLGTYQEMEVRQDTMENIYKRSLNEKRALESYAEIAARDEVSLFKHRLWIFMEYPTTRVAKLWIFVYSFLVFASLVIYTVITTTGHKHLALPTKAKMSNDGLVYDVKSDNVLDNTSHWLILIDILINVVFSFDLFLQFYCVPNQRIFLLSASTILEIICVGSYWLFIVSSCLIPFTGSTFSKTQDICLLAQLLRMVRCLRLTRILVDFRALIISLKQSLFEIAIIVLMILSAVFFFSILIQYIECGSEAGYFASMPTSLWWAINAITSVGYGDVHPTTHGGYVVGAMCALSGVFLTGLSVSILSNNLQLYYQYARTQARSAKLVDDGDPIAMSPRSHKSEDVCFNSFH